MLTPVNRKLVFNSFMFKKINEYILDYNGEYEHALVTNRRAVIIMYLMLYCFF